MFHVKQTDHMKNIIILFLLLSTNVAIAQRDSVNHSWSIGIRSGIALRHINLTTEYDFKSPNRQWENQIFIVRKIGKQFDLDISLEYTQKRSLETSQFSSTLHYDKAKTLSSTLLLRCHYLTFDRISLFVHGGFSLGGLSTNDENLIFTPKSSSDGGYYSYKTRTGYLLLGTGTRYQLSKRFDAYLHAELKYKDEATILFHEYPTHWSIRALASVAYRF